LLCTRKQKREKKEKRKKEKEKLTKNNFPEKKNNSKIQT